MPAMPKRSDQVIRRNKPEVPVEKVTAIGAVLIPELGIANPHPWGYDLYRSLKNTAQRNYFEPSDWHYARLTMYVLNDMLQNDGIGAMKLTAVNQMLASLLLTEGDRRRLRIEIERSQDGPEATVTQIADIYRERLKQQHP